MQDGNNSVYICCVDSQKKQFDDRVYQLKPTETDMKTVDLSGVVEDGMGFGLRAGKTNRKYNRQNSVSSEDSSDGIDAAGVSVIVSNTC